MTKFKLFTAVFLATAVIVIALIFAWLAGDPERTANAIALLDAATRCVLAFHGQ